MSECCKEVPSEKPFKRPEGVDCPVAVKCVSDPIVSVGTVVHGYASGSVELADVKYELAEDTSENKMKVSKWVHPKVYPQHIE